MGLLDTYRERKESNLWTNLLTLGVRVKGTKVIYRWESRERIYMTINLIGGKPNPFCTKKGQNTMTIRRL
jgi:hypothetical protein